MLKLNIQRFANPKLVIETDLNTKNFENGLDKIKSTTQRAGSTIKNIVVGLGITKAISFAINQITGSIDGAISRLDTLNQFPKVMESLGIASEDAEASIKKMSKKLEGLPTTLDAGANAVKRFTSYNNDVKKSTDMFLAVNNAILAGGASAEIQSAALEQLTQAYTKGKPEANDWKTIMQAMPAQLKQVAKTMGYTSTAIGGDFYEALMKGEITMDDFMNTVIELNEKGGDGFESFSKQAIKGTQGIRTAITNAKTAVVKGVTDIITALNTKIGGDGIGGYIKKLGEDAKKSLDTFSKLITGEISPEEFGNVAIKLVNSFLQKFNEQLPTILNTGLEIVLNLISGINQGIPQLVENVLQIPIIIIETIKNHFDDIVDVGGEFLIKFAEGIENKLPDLAIEIEKLSDVIAQKMEDPEFISKITEIGAKIVISFAIGMIKALPHLIQAKQNIQGEVNYLVLGLPRTMFETGKQMIIGLWNGIKGKIEGLPSKMYNWGKDMIQGFINGVTSKIGDIGKAVSKIASKISSVLHFSRPDEGPLREYEKWMPDMIKGLAKTMKSSSGILENETEILANKIKESMNFDDVYKDMAKAIDIEQAKLQANVETGRVFNTLQNTTPIVMNINADVEMDSQKVGRLITPEISRTIKSGGGY